MVLAILFHPNSHIHTIRLLSPSFHRFIIVVSREMRSMYHGDFQPLDELRQKFVKNNVREIRRTRVCVCVVRCVSFFLSSVHSIVCYLYSIYFNKITVHCFPWYCHRISMLLLVLFLFFSIRKLALRMLVCSSRTVFWTKSFFIPCFLFDSLGSFGLCCSCWCWCC